MAKAKSKSKAGADPKKRLKKLRTSLRADDDRRPPEADMIAELTELLDADATLLAEVDALALLPTAAERDQLDVYEWLLARGADPRVKLDDDAPPGLGTLIAATGDDARVIALAERALARGVDIHERSAGKSALDCAAETSLARVDALLRLGADATDATAALHIALARADRTPDRYTPIAERLLAHLESVDVPGHDGLSALHIVALRGTPALFEAVLARSADPGHAVATTDYYQCDLCSPPGGGLVPMVQRSAGFSARDLAVEVHAVYAAAVAWYGDEGFDAARRRRTRDALAEKAAHMAARGVPFGVATRVDLPAFVPEVDAMLARLCAHVGGDVEALQRRAAAIPAAGSGPWNYTSTLLERSGPILMRGAVEAHRGDSWLAHIISGDHRSFAAARVKQHGYGDPDVSLYPPEAHRPIKKGMVVGGRGDTLLVVWPHAEGVARLGEIGPGRFVELGDDFLDFLRRQLTALGVDVGDIAASGAAGPRGQGLYRVLKADYARKPGPKDIDRLGGLPIGVTADTWPRRAGAPMQHVLTIDLEQHPTYQPRGVRALALFISAAGDHEAYSPRNDHTRVVLLSADDLARGEPAQPADVELLDAGVLTYESAVTLTQEELYRHSFAGISPIWLQDDETEQFGDYDEYDGDEDGDDDDGDTRNPAPVHFVLQFDETLVPAVNLGDMGIMYVFAETAWFQCH